MALVGPTGSGKTTVLRSSCVCIGPRGQVRVGGTDVQRIENEPAAPILCGAARRVLFQGRLPPTWRLGVDRRERVSDLLERVGAGPLVEQREGGIDAVVREQGANFSAGERQLIAFARALYRDPPLMILDEATANVDSDTEARLQQAIEEATRERTALIIAHRLDHSYGRPSSASAGVR